MKKGFTLIELLAVIIILAILMIVAVPNVLNTLNTAKQKAFVTQAQSLWKAAEQKYIIDSMGTGAQPCYDTGELDLASISSDVSYVITMDAATGKTSQLVVVDTAQKFKISTSSVNGMTVTTGATDTSAGTCPAA